MKLIPFKVETKKITEDTIDYKLLGITKPIEDEDDIEIQVMYYNTKWLNEEVMHVHYKGNKTIISLWDGMCIHVRESLEDVKNKLNDTE